MKKKNYVNLESGAILKKTILLEQFSSRILSKS